MRTHLGSARSIECRTRPQYVLRLKRDSGRSRRPGREDVIVMYDCFLLLYIQDSICALVWRQDKQRRRQVTELHAWVNTTALLLPRHVVVWGWMKCWTIPKSDGKGIHLGWEDSRLVKAYIHGLAQCLLFDELKKRPGGLMVRVCLILRTLPIKTWSLTPISVRFRFTDLTLSLKIAGCKFTLLATQTKSLG